MLQVALGFDDLAEEGGNSKQVGITALKCSRSGSWFRYGELARGVEEQYGGALAFGI